MQQALPGGVGCICLKPDDCVRYIGESTYKSRFPEHMAKSCVSYRVLQHCQHETLRSPRGVCAESVGGNTSEANGFALTFFFFKTEFLGMWGKAPTILLHYRTFFAGAPSPIVRTRGHATGDSGSHNITLLAQTSCGLGSSPFSKQRRCQLPSNNKTCQLVDPETVSGNLNAKQWQ